MFALASFIATVITDYNDLNAPSDTGDIVLYCNKNCFRKFLNIDDIGDYENSVDFNACFAITKQGITCDIYRANNYKSGHIVTIDLFSFKNLCGLLANNVQSVRC
jgi:hypothetical protein